jgi:hypothetical protein
MWKMTLKQRRRQGELIARLDELKQEPYARVPEKYIFGDDPEEDDKYNNALETFKKLVEELHELEMAARDGV